MLKAFTHKSWFHFVLLMAWIAIGTALRFTNLTAKSPWADEFATLVFSLGNSFDTVPLDRAISLDTLLMPLQPRPNADIAAVFHNLMTESTHPPVYFILNHLWMQLFPPENGLASPYGIYQAQEARHYTLAILLIIASLSCLVIATRAIHNKTPFPIWVGLIWVVVNSLGIAVHYFFAIALCAEALVLLRFWSHRF